MEKNHIIAKASILLPVAAMALILTSCQKEVGDTVNGVRQSEERILNFDTEVSVLSESEEPSAKATLVNENGEGPVALDTSAVFYVAGWNVKETGGVEPQPPAITAFEKVKYVKGDETQHVNMWITVDDSTPGTNDIIEHMWKGSEGEKLFYAYCDVPAGSASVEGASTSAPVLKVSHSLSYQTDILMGYYKGDGTKGEKRNGTASILFQHPLAAVEFEMGTIKAPAGSFKITGIKLEGLYSEGTASMDKSGAITWSGCSGGGSVSQEVSETPESGKVGQAFVAIPQTFASDATARAEISATIAGTPIKLYIELKGDTWTAGKITKYKINYNAHKGIQLWSKGPYWATRNIGADNPEDYGWYFSWGNVEGFVPTDLTDPSNGGHQAYTKTCVWKSVKDGHVLDGGFTEDNYHKTPGYKDLKNKDIDSAHDAATQILGAGWRMPTKAELDTLLKSTYVTCTEIAINGIHYGYKFTGNQTGYTNRSIFLPAAGYGNMNTYYRESYAGYYWSKKYESISVAYSLQWDNAPGYPKTMTVATDVREYARTIRPVESFK